MSKKNEVSIVDAKENTESSVTYANEVISIIAGIAASEVEGIANMKPGGFNDYIGKNRNITKGVKVDIAGQEVVIDIYIVIEYGTPIQKAAHEIQTNVKKSVETMTDLHVLRVDIHVDGVSFDKENDQNKKINLPESIKENTEDTEELKGEEKNEK